MVRGTLKENITLPVDVALCCSMPLLRGRGEGERVSPMPGEGDSICWGGGIEVRHENVILQF